MNTAEWVNDLEVAFRALWQGFLEYTPEIIGAIVILILGWLIGSLLGRLVSRLIRSIRVDEALRGAGVDDVLQRGGIILNSGNFVGALIKWFIIIAALIGALGVLGLDAVNSFMGEVLLYIPNVIVAVLVLLIAAVVGEVTRKVIVASTRIASMGVSANFLGTVAKWAIWIFGLFIALNQLGIGEELIQILFTGLVAGLSIAVGLAFGLGGQQAAARVIEKAREHVSNR